MTPERWQQVKNTLAAALEKPDAAERTAFVARACGDDTGLHREVQSLLDQPDDEFDSVAEMIGAANAEPMQTANAGRRVGNYELLRELGRGGMGTVWLAKRADRQFEKLVAIKLLKRGTDTEEVLRRFYAERQILARLDHPNIARLLDAGETEEALPYFVMEYVEGTRLTDFVWAEDLSLGERLQLFIKICSAVQFAHQNLVVHRDLKPANILVTTDREPKLLDFGVAKLLAHGDDALQITIAGQERFTPAYASPEQVRGEPITTVSDVYSLGALLYEILTGTTAHRFASKTPTASQLHRVICEEEPLRPSVATRDHETGKRLRGDLDTIVLRALAKDPKRRYRGAAQLGDELRRYLENRPVRARPDTLLYRTEKFLRRNKIGTAAAVLVTLALIGGAAMTEWQARKTQRQFQQTRRLAHSVLFDYHDAIANLPGSTAIREKLVKDSLQYLDGLLREGVTDRSLQREIAHGYLKVGDVQGGPYRANLGDTESASVSYRKACEILEKLSAADSTNRQTQKDLTLAYGKLGGIQLRKGLWDESLRTQEKSVAIAEKLVAADRTNPEYLDLLAQAYLHFGQASYLGKNSLSLPAQFRALEKFQQALKIAESLSARDPRNVSARERIAVYTIYVSYAQSAIGRLKGDRTSMEAAVQNLQRGYDIYESLSKADPLNVSARRNAALTLTDLARAKLALQDNAGARADAERSLAPIRELANADPANLEAQNDLADVEAICAAATLSCGDNLAALDHSHAALAIYALLLKDNSASVELKELVARAYDVLADAELKSGNTLKALETQRHALELLEGCTGASGWSTDLRQLIGMAHAKIGDLYERLAETSFASPDERQTNWRSARSEYQAALDSWQRAENSDTVGLPKTRRDEVATALAKCEAALTGR